MYGLKYNLYVWFSAFRGGRIRQTFISNIIVIVFNESIKELKTIILIGISTF